MRYLLLIWGLWTTCLPAQDWQTGLHMHLTPGALVTTDNFVFIAGGELEGRLTRIWNQHVESGLSAGVATFNQVWLLPVQVSSHLVRPSRQEGASRIYSLRLGYAPGWDPVANQTEFFRFQGGFRAGIQTGRRWSVGSGWRLEGGIGYLFQQTRLGAIDAAGMINWQDNLYHFLQLQFGVSKR
ncbi:MAG: hypothetical protein AAFV07_09775 [Bacteroidota bacterium]